MGRNLNQGGEWDRVPDDGTAADTDRFQTGVCRDGWRAGVLLGAIALIILGVAAAFAMCWRMW